MNWCYAVLSYNHCEHTRHCLNSIIRQDPNARIYLIHNGTDTKQRLGLENDFPSTSRFTHIVLEENRGYSGGLNFGLAQIFLDEEFVFVLTNDTELQSVPACPVPPGVTIPLILNKRTQKVDSFGGYFVPNRGHLYHNKDLSSSFRDSKNRLTYVPGSAFVIDRDSFIKTNGFWTELGTYWEDVDWSQRLKQAQCPINLNSDFQLVHKIGKTCHKDKFYTTYLFQRNRFVISWRYSLGWQRVGLLLQTVLLTGKWIFKSFRSFNFSSLRLYVRALRHAIKMIKENAHRPQGVR